MHQPWAAVKMVKETNRGRMNAALIMCITLRDQSRSRSNFIPTATGYCACAKLRNTIGVLYIHTVDLYQKTKKWVKNVRAISAFLLKKDIFTNNEIKRQSMLHVHVHFV